MNLWLLISFGYMPTNLQKSAVSIKIVWGKECGDYCHYCTEVVERPVTYNKQ